MDNYDIIKNMYKMMGLQAGYKLDDKKEFEIVRKTLILNGLPCENFDRNLERLVIEKSNIFDYVPSLCKIHVVPGYDNLVHELFHMASSIYKDGIEYGQNVDVYIKKIIPDKKKIKLLFV